LSAEAAFNSPGANLLFAERTSFELAIFHDRTHPFAAFCLIKDLASRLNLRIIAAETPNLSVTIPIHS
jgi:hypothetical protein